MDYASTRKVRRPRFNICIIKNFFHANNTPIRAYLPFKYT